MASLLDINSYLLLNACILISVLLPVVWLRKLLKSDDDVDDDDDDFDENDDYYNVFAP